MADDALQTPNNRVALGEEAMTTQRTNAGVDPSADVRGTVLRFYERMRAGDSTGFDENSFRPILPNGHRIGE